MSNENSGRGQRCSNSFPICHIPLNAQTDMPCLCIGCQSHASIQAFNPMQNHAQQNSSNSSFSVLNDPLQPMFHIQNDQEASKQMIKYEDEIDSWLVFDIEEGQRNNLSYLNEGCLDAKDFYYNPLTEIQQPQDSHNAATDGMMPFQYYPMEAIQQHEQVIELHPGIDCDVSQDAVTNTTTILTQPQISDPLNEYGMEATIGSISNPKDVPTEEPFDQFPYSLIKSCNISEPIIPRSSNSNLPLRRRIRKFFSRAFKIRRYNFPPMSREEKVQRYLQKRKARKFGKKIRYASRKTHAENRPRVRSRFAKKLKNEVEVDQPMMKEERN